MKNLYFKNILEKYIEKYITDYDNLNQNELNVFLKLKQSLHGIHLCNLVKHDHHGQQNENSFNNFNKIYLSNKLIINNVLTFFSEVILESCEYKEFMIQIKNLIKCELEPILKIIIIHTVYDSIKITWLFKRFIHRTNVKKMNNNIIILNEINMDSENITNFKNSEIMYLYENKLKTSNEFYKCWWFSSNELLKLLKNGLTNQMFMTPNPQIFKNPYSNVELSYLEICNIYTNIINNVYKNKKIPTWLYLFRCSQFNLQKYKCIAKNVLYEHCTEMYLGSLDQSDYFEHLYDLFIYHDIKSILCKKCITNNYNKVFKLFNKVLINFICYNNYDDPYYKHEVKRSKIIIANIIRNNLWITKNHVH